jgi:hypothetical protein
MRLRHYAREAYDRGEWGVWLFHAKGAELRVAAELLARRLDLNAEETRRARRLERKRRR